MTQQLSENYLFLGFPSWLRPSSISFNTSF